MTDKHKEHSAERVLTEEQRLYVERWCHAEACRLGLAGWTIRVSAYVAFDGSEASTYIRDRSDMAEIAVGREFATKPAAEQRTILIHELFHPHFHRITQLAAELIEHELGKRTEAIIDNAISFQEELTIERIANALAPLFPPVELPPSE